MCTKLPTKTPEKMATIVPIKFYNALLMKILNEILQMYVCNGAVNNKPVLIRIIAWCQTGNKPLSEPMMS